MAISTISHASVLQAQRVLRPRVRHTPVLRVSGDELGVDAKTISLKLEHLQHSGSFKARGALNALLMATATGTVTDVIAASGGNHGAGVAWAASQLGIRATIVVPTIAAPTKVERLRNYGAHVVQIGDVYADAFAEAQRRQAETGALSIHAYNDPAVMSGAGTVAAELCSQTEDIDSLWIACGGGGLSGGTAAYLLGLESAPQLMVCETEGTASFHGALQAGQPTAVAISGIAADSLGATQIGDNPWQQLTAVDAQAHLVTDTQVVDARQALWDRCRLQVEPAAAVSLAALQASGHDNTGDHVGLILCGANA